MPGNRSAIARTASWRRTRVEMVTINATPCAAARATTASVSAAKSGKSRWQWLSTSMASGRFAGFRLDVARKDRNRWRQRDAGRYAVRAAEPREVARVRRNAEEIEQLAGRARHEGLGQDRDLAHDLGGDVKDGRHAGPVGLGKRP